MAVVTPPEASSDAPQTRGRGRVSFLTFLLLVVVIAVAAYIGFNVLTVLFAVVSPPLPPMPANIVETQHENVAYGVDRWRYTSTENGCTLVRFLEENGGVCEYAPMQCMTNPDETSQSLISEGIVARCIGNIDFSIFTMNWFGLVVQQSATQSQLDLDREVFWLGTGREQ